MIRVSFKPTYLYVKTHNQTGLKYFGKTTQKDPFKYKGSGKYWKRHLKIHGNDVSTEIIGYYTNVDECRYKALSFSKDNNIIDSKEWANFREEDGLLGGDSTSNTKWITNGQIERLIANDDGIEEGFDYGRCVTNCVFKDSKRQKEFSLRVDRNSEKFLTARKTAWLKTRHNRDHSKCGTRGDHHHTKTEAVKRKIALATSKPIQIDGVNYPSIKEASIVLNLTRYQIGKLLNDKTIKKE